MPRQRRLRRICFCPPATFFRPRGVARVDLKTVELGVDELEALRLADTRGMDQNQAAQQMKVSQSTFQRILAVAREKAATALVNGLAIELKGGEFLMPRPRRGLGRGAGPVAQKGRGRMSGRYAAGPGGVCVCTNPKCDCEVPHKTGVACYQVKCEKCGRPMVRKQ